MFKIQVHETGAAEVMRYEEVPKPNPGKGELLIKVQAAGVNFIDIYHRKGLYPLPLPFTPGREIAGVIDAVGEDTAGYQVGDQVAYFGNVEGYAEYALIPADRAVSIPDGISTDTAAATMLQGMTAHYLALDTYPIQAGDTILVHAAAGGVGLLLVQITKRLGATVIGTVSTQEKADLATSAGADHIILYTQSDFEEETKKITDGVDVVYDSVGITTFDKGLNLLKPRGMMVLYGQASGPVPPFDLQRLNQGGSLFVTRPSLFDYVRTRDELLRRSGDLFEWIAAGELAVRIDQRFQLSEAAEAHRYMEARKSRGKVLLVP
ncbi:MAG: quinone oxidoreductase [Ardenticatenaceae bacterium]|nr:quinone oxidoreductase [Ardenticatenaceae bacterium]